MRSADFPGSDERSNNLEISKKGRNFPGPALGSLADCCPPTHFDFVLFVVAGILSRLTGFLIADKIFRDVCDVCRQATT